MKLGRCQLNSIQMPVNTAHFSSTQKHRGEGACSLATMNRSSLEQQAPPRGRHQEDR